MRPEDKRNDNLLQPLVVILITKVKNQHFITHDNFLNEILLMKSRDQLQLAPVYMIELRDDEFTGDQSDVAFFEMEF